MKHAPEKRHAIDWSDIRARLTRVAAAIESTERLSPERAKALLDERARVLAVPPPPTLQASERLEVAIFDLANERYAIETCHLREIVPIAEFTPVPGAPEFLVGVTNLRGEILAVVDLRKLLSVPVREVTDSARMLVVGADRPEFGILADAVHEVARLRTEQILDPPVSVTGIGREWLRGVTRDSLIVLDGAVLLRHSQLFIDQGNDSIALKPDGRK